MTDTEFLFSESFYRALERVSMMNEEEVVVDMVFNFNDEDELIYLHNRNS